MRIVVSALMLSVLVLSCSKQHPYWEAVGLIKSKQYDRAKAELLTIPIGDSLTPKVAIALQTCEIGSLYQQRKWDKAIHLIDSVVQRGGERVFVLNPSPADTLYSHIATLCMLVSCHRGVALINEFLAAPVNDSVYSDYGMDGNLEQALVGVLETSNPDEYHEVDIDKSEGEFSDTPFIRSIGFDKLWVPPEWKAEVGELKKTLDELRPKYKQRWAELECASQEASDARTAKQEEVLVQQNTFASSSDAVNWLGGGSGVWVQDDVLHAKALGIDVKIVNIFRLNPYSGKGTITVCTVDASTLRDVEKRSTIDTWIMSTEKNMVKFALRSEWSTGEMTRTGENTAMLKGIGKMTRK